MSLELNLTESGKSSSGEAQIKQMGAARMDPTYHKLVSEPLTAMYSANGLMLALMPSSA
jgi:hypothetical protein